MTLMIFNAENTTSEPKKFRYPIQKTEACRQVSLPVQGLEHLHISASGQFAENHIPFIQKAAGGRPVIIVDLRQESHGFMDGHAISWHVPRNWINAEKTDGQAAEDELQRLKQLSDEKEAIISRVKRKDEEAGTIVEKEDITLPVHHVLTEEKLVQSYRCGYQRFYVTDHSCPSEEVVRQFFNFFGQLPRDAWLHVHCSAGMGRSTTFMTMVDMLHCARNLSLEDIVQRQAVINQYDLFGAKEGWKQPYAEARAAFIRQFYQQVKQ